MKDRKIKENMRNLIKKQIEIEKISKKNKKK